MLTSLFWLFLFLFVCLFFASFYHLFFDIVACAQAVVFTPLLLCRDCNIPGSGAGMVWVPPLFFVCSPVCSLLLSSSFTLPLGLPGACARKRRLHFQPDFFFVFAHPRPQLGSYSCLGFVCGVLVHLMFRGRRTRAQPTNFLRPCLFEGRDTRTNITGTKVGTALCGVGGGKQR